MHLPHLKAGKQILETQDLFFGRNHNLRLRPGEFYDTENLTSDLCPVLSPRAPRGVIREQGNIQGLCDREGLVYAEGDSLYLNGYPVPLGLSTDPEDCPKQLVSMGAYLLVLPDKKYVNTANLQEFGSVDAEFVSKGPVTLIQCSLDGTEIRPAYAGPSQPENPEDQVWWLDTEEKQLKQYAASTGLWVVLETPFVKLGCAGAGKAFGDYDGVTLSGLPESELWDLNGSAVLYGRGEDYLIFPGLIREPVTFETPVTVSRNMPDLDFVVESGNRLWGCRYGPDREGKVVNELYCSKLGDFKNWSCYLGISTDSYRVSLGSDGPFTGAANLGGHPIFFKERFIHKVFGQFPANFQVQTAPAQGVSPGCHGSLALLGQVLYYKSDEGICVYDGSQPRLISQALGKEVYGRAVGAACGNKYYVSLEKGEGFDFLVYDGDRGFWLREDGLEAKFLCSCREDLYCVDGRGRLLSLLGKSGTPEKQVPWMAESGIIGVSLPGNRYLQKLQIRMVLEPGARMSLEAEYDSSGLWENLGSVMGMGLRSFTFPVLPRRCDHLRLRIRGEGRGKIFAVTRVLSPGGEG